MYISVNLNNGERLELEPPSRNANIATLARQISECALVYNVTIDDPATGEREVYSKGATFARPITEPQN